MSILKESRPELRRSMAFGRTGRNHRSDRDTTSRRQEISPHRLGDNAEHVHILIVTLPGYSVSEIMHSLKSFTSHEANKILGRTGSFWYKEYFDRYIRDGKQFRAVVRYIEENPVKARLCKKPEDWKYSSAFFKKDL